MSVIAHDGKVVVSGGKTLSFDNLIELANNTTGESDTTLTDAVQRLVDGYGGVLQTVYSSDTSGALYTEDFTMPDRETLNTGSCSYENSTHLKKLNVGKNYNLGQMTFKGCTNLEIVKMKSCATREMFWNCSRLKYCTVYKECASVNDWTFDTCNALVAVIFPDNELLPLTNVNAFSVSSCRVGGSGRIYVPSALLNDYKSATNWSTFAANILAIEDNMDVVGDYL